jgi:hypothetical protein
MLRRCFGDSFILIQPLSIRVECKVFLGLWLKAKETLAAAESCVEQAISSLEEMNSLGIAPNFVEKFIDLIPSNRVRCNCCRGGFSRLPLTPTEHLCTKPALVCQPEVKGRVLIVALSSTNQTCR